MAAVLFLAAVLTGAACGLPQGGDPVHISLFNMSFAFALDRTSFYETTHFIAALQGLANRDAPSLYLDYTPSDQPWLDYLRKPSNFLENATITNIGSLDTLVSTFRSVFDGVVLYDGEQIAALSLVASTVAGAENLLPVCRRSSASNPTIYDRFVLSGLLPVRRFLNASMFPGKETGSTKGDAYMWAIREFINTNKSDTANMAYYIDYYWTRAPMCCGDPTTDKYMSTLSNHDWFISKRAFFWDLSVWDDEKPVDDPTQPLGTDLKVLQAVAAAAYAQVGGGAVIHVGGFTPWAYKYVAPYGKHQGVETEWQTMKVLSAYNVYVDADACCIGEMANAALYAHAPLPERFPPLTFPSAASLVAKGALRADGSVVPQTYYYWYAGDYDSASWLYSQLLPKWTDDARGSVPIGWAIDPNLAMRFPVMFSLLHATRTANDTFIAGDSGAGYLNPTQLYEPRQYSGLPSGVAAWQAHNRRWFNKFGLSVTGFVINGVAPMTVQAEADYAAFSPNGITVQSDGPRPTVELRNGTLPVFHEAADIVNVDVPTAAKQMCAFHGGDAVPHFMMFRTILESATFMRDASLAAEALCGLRVVSPAEMGALARVFLGGNNNFIVGYISDTVPRRLAAGGTVQASFVVRNDGWNALQKQCIHLQVSLGSETTTLPLGWDVVSGASATVSGTIMVPAAPGLVELQYSLVSQCGDVIKSMAYSCDVLLV